MTPLDDPEKLRELADSWRRVSDSPRDCFSEFSDHLDAAAARIASQAAEIAELKASLDACDRFWKSVSPIPFSDELAFMLGKGPDPDPTAQEIASLKSQLAAAEAERDEVKAKLATELRRGDLYSQLADALGCDAMDSHDGRISRALRLATAEADRDKWKSMAQGYERTLSQALNEGGGVYKP